MSNYEPFNLHIANERTCKLLILGLASQAEEALAPLKASRAKDLDEYRQIIQDYDALQELIQYLAEFGLGDLSENHLVVNKVAKELRAESRAQAFGEPVPADRDVQF